MDPLVFGSTIRPPSESEEESESSRPRRLNWDWTLKREKDVEISDLSSFDNDPTPFCYICSRFVYKNKAQKDQEQEIQKALLQYKERSRNLTPFDAIPVPPKIKIMASNFPTPLDITDNEDRTTLIELSQIALAQYNVDQGSNYDFDGLVKAATQHMPRYTYYITFKAKDVTSNFPAIILQTHIWDMRTVSDKPPQPSVVVKSCSIKP